MPPWCGAGHARKADKATALCPQLRASGKLKHSGQDTHGLRTTALLRTTRSRTRCGRAGRLLSAAPAASLGSPAQPGVASSFGSSPAQLPCGRAIDFHRRNGARVTPQGHRATLTFPWSPNSEEPLGVTRPGALRERGGTVWHGRCPRGTGHRSAAPCADGDRCPNHIGQASRVQGGAA